MAELLPRLTSVSSHSHVAASCDEAWSIQINDLIAFLKQPSNASAITSSSDYLLDNLDPSRHSLAYLFVFHLHVQSIQRTTKSPLPSEILPGGRLWLNAVHFLRHFDPVQIRYAGMEWRQLIELVAQAAQLESKPLLAVLVIRDSIFRLGITDTFTSVHLLFVRLSLLAKTYTHALPILDRQVCHLPNPSNQGYQQYRHLIPCTEHGHNAALVPETSGFSAKLAYRDHLSYFLCGAMVYTVLKDWNKAIHWLSIVISSPVTGPVSKIMVEAYKKWLLVNLLGQGKLSSPPSVVPSHVMRVYEALTKPYMSLAEAFEKCHYERFLREVEMGRTIWHIDNNTGLVSQLAPAFDKFIILRLGRTFSALKMSDVAWQRFSAGQLSPRQIEAFVASLVMSGRVSAVLFHLRDNINSTMLRFASRGGQALYYERHLRTKLNFESQLVKTIANGIDHSKSGLGFSNEHFQFLHKNQRCVDTPARVAFLAESQADSQIHGDEDIMEDLH
ncbi:COP9 signalosome complex subunit 3 [Aspergillus steynii IBT 23096]|uniref:COP9 signalosome complex subunit 3 n=1 Tax=Aspergillus steynii IBT 23096 TaxID=1392250 RepID=A0A2I2FU26_9EURO|nr:COP9 signalosome complex subunit 3 [Aspergillus steynii IBT 23096]PLB44087.1 COP9 signalosome complex subunit 3 [Aspergillus steynii IBT 23096]